MTPTRFLFRFVFALLLACAFAPVRGAATINMICPAGGVQPRPADFKPGGIILASFDNASLWVYNITSNRRYPLPETHPCGSNCRLSLDGMWVTYVDSDTSATYKMHIDGTARTPLVNYAADVEWWNSNTLLVWTPGRDAYLEPEAGGDRQYLDVKEVVSVQPGGHWGLMLRQQDDDFLRSLVDLQLRGLQGIAESTVELGRDVPYFDAAAWSPDGQWLAYVNQVEGSKGGELYGVQPGGKPVQWTRLTDEYGPVRINGRSSAELSWSPDGTRVAFWVLPLKGSQPDQQSGAATIHILNVQTGEVRAYCGYTTTAHTPNPPRLIWSPDSTHLAFGGALPKGSSYLLISLDTDSGVFTQLSEGLYPVLGGPNPVAWGNLPG
jgi:WD40 repeat protein